MRSRFFVFGALVWVILAVTIYVTTSRIFATGVTLSIVGGECVCNEDVYVSCVLSNGASKVISFFKIYDDGFGYSLEWQKDGNWMTSGVTWCATGRDIVKLNAAEVYSFRVKVPLNHCRWRLSVEYWDDEPLVSAPKQAKSEPFVCEPANRSAIAHQ